MNKIILYHGSDKIINKPKLSLGKKNNDYGQGFYCTEDLELAKEWACKFGENGFANEYKIDLGNLNVLDISTIKNEILVWISLLIKNRFFEKTAEQEEIAKLLIKYYGINLDQYDVVMGYRADDSYFSYAQRFLDNSLSLEKLEEALKLGLLGKQIVLISEKAFENIKYVKSYEVDKDVYFNKYLLRDESARSKYKQMTENIQLDGTFLYDLLRKKVKR